MVVRIGLLVLAICFASCCDTRKTLCEEFMKNIQDLHLKGNITPPNPIYSQLKKRCSQYEAVGHKNDLSTLMKKLTNLITTNLTNGVPLENDLSTLMMTKLTNLKTKNYARFAAIQVSFMSISFAWMIGTRPLFEFSNVQKNGVLSIQVLSLFLHLA